MDENLIKLTKIESNPIVALANWFQFSAGSEATHRQVESRMLLWCEKGNGTVTVNSERTDFHPGDWLFLPWKHRIVYQASALHPFLVGGIHLIPDHAIKEPAIFQVAHGPREFLADHPGRRDAEWPGLEGLVHGHFDETDRLRLLATYTVERFQSPGREQAAMSELARLLVGELRWAAQPRPAGTRPLPGILRRLRDHLEENLGEKITIGGMAGLAGTSVASLHRLCQEFLGMSPGRYVAQLRAEKACVLLRTTSLTIPEIGAQLGMPDPFHFSRFFKRKTGQSPRHYQESHRFF